MPTRSSFLFAALVLSMPVMAILSPIRGHGYKMNLPSGKISHHIDGGSLPDPSGVAHTRQEVAGKVVVAMFSVPDMSQGPAQRKWSDLLTGNADSKLPDQVVFVLVENMAAAGSFKDEATDDMKQQFDKDKRPFLLLDATGSSFRRFGIPRDKTEILIFDKTGALRDVEKNLDNEGTTTARIKGITRQLLGKGT